ncbi:FGGY-family carbohydrate kinase [Deinococcus malanensis]|uniref:FGGY-family carbohydrate kinase n=1 Tax=Deinococcus malanensis TaxID=1706855 RepID=UPI0036286D45
MKPRPSHRGAGRDVPSVPRGRTQPAHEPGRARRVHGPVLAHGRAHLVRAVLEGTAGALADAFDVIRPLAPLRTLLSTGGGARSDLWLGLVSGALNVPVQPTRAPGAANGAAILAMPAAGLHPDLQTAMQATRPDVQEPVQTQEMHGALRAYEHARATLYPTPATSQDPNGPQDKENTHA